MNLPITPLSVAAAVWDDFRRARRELLVYDVLFKMLEAWILVPIVALLLSTVLKQTGRIAVSNKDILDFLLTPTGLVYAALFGTFAVAFLLFEQGGIMAVTALTETYDRSQGKRMLARGWLYAAAAKPLRILKLGAIKVVLLALAFLPFVVLAFLAYGFLLAEHDINFYLQDRPPRFWIAVVAGALVLAGAVFVGLTLYVRWSLALPILLFEEQSALSALRSSRERVRGAEWRIALVLVGWYLVALLAGLALQAALRFIAGLVLAALGESVILILLLLLGQGTLIAVWSFFAVVGAGLITRRLYLMRSPQRQTLAAERADAEQPAAAPIRPWAKCLLYLSVILMVVAPIALWVQLNRYLQERPSVQVTAHRGHARAAPENTLSALRRAMESGADFAEIDVQFTADGRIVLVHDRDMMRVAGDPRRVEDLTYEQIRTLDAGRWFDPAFAGEQVPTLAEAIDLVRGRMKLNIEIKLYGPNEGLAEAVARLVREKEFESECVLTSFDYDAVQAAKRTNPNVRIGFIVAQALGDVSRLNVDVLSIRADALSDDLLRDAHRRGMEIHVWTVNDPRQMAQLIKRGVNNILTSDPDVLLGIRGQWENLAPLERLVLASKLLLGLEP